MICISHLKYPFGSPIFWFMYPNLTISIKNIKSVSYLLKSENILGSKDDDMFKSPRMTNNERSIKLLLPEDTLASNNNLSIRAGINSRSVHTGSTMRSRRLESPRKQFSPNTKLNFSPKKIISTFR